MDRALGDAGRRDIGLEDDAGRDKSKVHAAEEEQPAPRDRPVRQQPVVEQSIERQHRRRQERVLDVVGIPELGPVGELEHGDKPDEPAAPHRTFAAYGTTPGSAQTAGANLFAMAPMSALSKTRLPVKCHGLGCA